MQTISQYLSNLQKEFKTGSAKEHSYRPAFKTLVESLSKNIVAINEPSYTGGNAPDFLFKKGETPVAYAECKDIDVDTQNKDVQKQAFRYVEAFGGILLTNYIDFEFIKEGQDPVHISIAKISGSNIEPIAESFEKFSNLLQDYLVVSHRTIRSAKKLAEIMASKARLLRDSSLAALEENQNSDVYAQYTAFKEVLIKDLSEKEFADMYAQTLVYGLFVARYFDETITDFSRHEAQDLLPSTNPLLKKFFGHVAGTEFDSKIAWIVDDLVEAYKSTNVRELMHKEFEKKQKDPVLHFYETFLAEYDQNLRKSRGVYYTPEPVVSFIVCSVDQILKEKFNLSKGLADTAKIDHEFKASQGDGRTKDGLKKITEQIHKVQILDPAVGTGTFLNEVIHEIHKSFVGQEGQWSSYAKENLLPRLHGFELMMASYTMAHLKLGVTLKELGYEGNERLSVWLTNSLEESVHEVPNLFMSQWLTQESNEASKIKSEMPIMVVLGNPPYSGESFNKNYSGHDVYKVEPGGKQKLQERNSKWLNDDYVKFIRLAESQIEKTREGVVSFITPHGYLDNPTFRGMRWHLMQTFDEIYVLDLHGNANKKEVSPDGGKDENVFGIKTGTSIIFAVKNKENENSLAKVYHNEFYGKQKEKYQKLNENDWGSVGWKVLEPSGPNLYFVPFDNEAKSKYEEGFAVKDLFSISGAGIVTSRDNMSIQYYRKNIVQVISDFSNKDVEDLRSKYNLRKDVRDWSVAGAKSDVLKNDGLITEISYRPFDNRWTYYNGRSKGFHCMPRGEIMKHFIDGVNLGLVFVQRSPSKTPVSYFFISSKIISNGYIRLDSVSIDSLAPLYLYQDDGLKTPNLDQEIWDKINKVVGETKPENILDYIYAVLYSPSYREKYKEFLKIDFPRVPYPENKDKFWKIVELGQKLRSLHLLESPKVNDFMTTFSEPGSNIIEKGYPKYEDEKVYINKNQYFGNVPDPAWNFYIGGYQPAQKWLKDRRERELSNEDIDHYQKIIVALSETERIMKEIDKVWNCK